MATDDVEIRYGRLRLHVPGDWEDRTTVSFLAPAAAGLAAPKSVKPPDRFRRALQVSVERKPTDVASPRGLLEAAHVVLKQTQAGLEVLEEKAIELAGQPGWCAVRRLFVAETLVRQHAACAFVGELVVVATVSVAESGHEQHRAEVDRLLASVRLA